MLAQSPQRDRDIEDLQTLIRNCSAIGIPAIKYNLCIVSDLRTGRSPGRGDSTYSTWRLKDARPASPLTRAGRVDADAYLGTDHLFSRARHPGSGGIQGSMALHPLDPYVPAPGYQGVDCVFGTVDGLKRFIEINAESVSRPELLPG